MDEEDILVEYTVGFYLPAYRREDGTLDRDRIAETWADTAHMWLSEGTTPDGDMLTIWEEDER